jgi:hypothetical protein
VEREEQRKASGLYTPTAAEVDRLGRETAHGIPVVVGKRRRPREESDDELAGPDNHLGFLLGAALVALFLAYAVVRLVIDLVRLVIWLVY